MVSLTKRGHIRRSIQRQMGQGRARGQVARRERMNTPHLRWKPAVHTEDGEDETCAAKRNMSVLRSEAHHICMHTLFVHYVSERQQFYAVSFVRAAAGPARTPLTNRPPRPKRFHAMVGHGTSSLGHTATRHVPCIIRPRACRVRNSQENDANGPVFRGRRDEAAVIAERHRGHLDRSTPSEKTGPRGEVQQPDNM